MISQENQCQNCEENIKASDNFCPNCGQKTDEHLTVGVLFYNTISNYFSFDARFLKSFIPLLFRPGYLAKKYISGKRLLYLHPAQMYLFVSVLFFFVLSFSVNEWARNTDEKLKKTNLDDIIADVDEDINNNKNDAVLDSLKLNTKIDSKSNTQNGRAHSDKVVNVADSIAKKGQLENKQNTFKVDGGGLFSERKKRIDSLIKINASDDTIFKAFGISDQPSFFEQKTYEQSLKLYKTRGVSGFIHRFFDSVPIAMFFLLPIFALLLKIFYYKKKRGTFAHHLVFSFYYFSFLFAVFSLLFGLNRFIDIPDWIDWLIATSTFFYLLVAIIRFYKQNWALSFIKTSMITFGFLLFVIPFSFVILFFFSFLFF